MKCELNSIILLFNSHYIIINSFKVTFSFFSMDDDPFPDMYIADASFLDEQSERTHCPKCNKQRKYYCYCCYVLVGDGQDKIPQIKVFSFSNNIIRDT